MKHAHLFRTRFIRVTLLLLTGCAVLACDRAASPGQATPPTAADPRIKPLPTVDMTIAGRTFRLEVADDDEERRTGLMYRTSMPADAGMLFVFDGPVNGGFWMKDTNIPLDIAYVGADGVVNTVAALHPRDRTEVGGAAPYQYAIELNQGTAARIGLKVGDRLTLPPLPK